MVCVRCGKMFRVWGKREKTARYCSMKCVTFLIEIPCEFCKKLFTPNSSTRKYCSQKCYFSTVSERTTLENNPMWKGDKVGYKCLHKWIKRHKGILGKCLHCGEIKKRRVWANVSGKYLRDLNDWIPLCYSCHWKFDKQDWWLDHLIGKTPWNKGIKWPRMQGKNHPCWKDNKEMRICLSCKKEFLFRKSPSRCSRGHYCSRSCASRESMFARYAQNA